MINTIEKAEKIKGDVLDVSIRHSLGHVAPSLSCLDILTCLYYHSAKPSDTIILSKGHGCYALYSILADKGIIPQKKWNDFDLPGCLEGYGSLGHGLPVAVGEAFANQKLGNDKHVWVIVGDGELQEGSNWEALSFMFHHELQNITVIVDCNGLQAMDEINNILWQMLPGRFIGWGFDPEQCDAHDHNQLKEHLDDPPSILLARAIKGKGVSYMENKAEWHFKVPYNEC